MFRVHHRAMVFLSFFSFFFCVVSFILYIYIPSCVRMRGNSRLFAIHCKATFSPSPLPPPHSPHPPTSPSRQQENAPHLLTNFLLSSSLFFCVLLFAFRICPTVVLFYYCTRKLTFMKQFRTMSECR